MQEIFGDLWTVEADAICITTNGVVTKAGKAVMGAGCALQAQDRYPGIAKELGRLISRYGNHAYWLGPKNPWLFSFPVKHHWRQQADLGLIERSAHELSDCLSTGPWSELKRVVLPRPGCGNGGLRWEDVKPVLEPILDDRFLVITWT